MADDKIVLFPTNKIANKDKVGVVNEEEHRAIVEKKTQEFVEAAVDDIAYTLIDKFLNAGINTKRDTFMVDLALAIDTIRGLIYRDFKKHHPAQTMADKMVHIKIGPNGEKNAICRYDLVIADEKPREPLSNDIKDEVRDINEMGDIEFIPDFDPDNDK